VPKEIAETRRVLIIDDDVQFADSLVTVFDYEGYEVEAVPCEKVGPNLEGHGSFDLIVLTVLRSGRNHLDTVRRVSSLARGIPVLYVLGEDEQRDRIALTTDNSDRYIVGSSSLKEIVGRANALLSSPDSHVDAGLLCYADLVLDEASHEVWRAGTSIHLSPTEFDLLRFFLTFPRQVLSKEQILEEVWHHDFDGNAKVVETYVRYLRRRLDPLGVPLIQTIRLVGYVLREPDNG
jgi:two-component system, OmpR family, response regulator